MRRTLLKPRVNFYDEAGLYLLVCNPVFAHSKRNTREAEIFPGKKGVSWTLMLIYSMQSIEYDKLIARNADTAEYQDFWEK